MVTCLEAHSVRIAFLRAENPKRDGAVESHPCAQNAQGWGTRRPVASSPHKLPESDYNLEGLAG